MVIFDTGIWEMETEIINSNLVNKAPLHLNNFLAISLSATLSMLVLALWFLNKTVAYDNSLFVISGGVALFLLIKFICDRHIRNFLLLLPWLGLYVFFLFAGRQARDAAQEDAILAQTKGNCGDIECLRQLGFSVTKIGGAEGVIVERFGASVFIKFSRHEGECRFTTDYFFGGGKVFDWKCEDAIGGHTALKVKS
jgi:hypothetical protein